MKSIVFVCHGNICRSPMAEVIFRDLLEQQGLTFLSAEVDKIPQNTVAIDDPEVLKSIQKLLEMLDDNDDVQNVFHNAELPEEEDEE